MLFLSTAFYITAKPTFGLPFISENMPLMIQILQTLRRKEEREASHAHTIALYN